eukprot:992396-Prymnesium_polylepis.2
MSCMTIGPDRVRRLGRTKLARERACHLQLDIQYDDTATKSTACWCIIWPRASVSVTKSASASPGLNDRNTGAGSIFHGGHADRQRRNCRLGTARVANKEAEIRHGRAKGMTRRDVGDRRATINDFISILNHGASSRRVASVAAWRQLVERAAPRSTHDYGGGSVCSMWRSANEKDGYGRVLPGRNRKRRFLALNDAKWPGASGQIMLDKRLHFEKQLHCTVGRNAIFCCRNIIERCADGDSTRFGDI